ncbi:MAG: hypothetical protein KDL87_08600, partial [Verrucomicrobiae bacterium]|nr:hypothetical protein [Verrucomicrobiae bacterium]
STLDALRGLNRSYERLPVVFQYNKRDLPNAMRPEDMDEALGATRPSYLACANSGYNVFATLDAVTQTVLREFHRRRRMRAMIAAAAADPHQAARQTSPPTTAPTEAPQGRRETPSPQDVALGS